MILRRALLAACCVLASLGMGQTKYSLQAKTVNVGVVLLASDTQLFSGTAEINNWTPFVWYNLDANSTVKPAGWSFDNPTHASTLVSSYSRWNQIAGLPPADKGMRLSKNMAPYWEIQLENITDAQIAQYNVLLISAHATTLITPDEREKLHKFMDQGGIVWVDLNIGTGLDLFDTFPLPFAFSTAASGPGNFFANFQDPLLSFPFGVTFRDLANMTGPNPFSNTGGTLAGITALAAADYTGELNAGGAAPLVGDSQRMNTVFGTFGSPGNSVISVGQVGDGYEVVTTNDLATQLGSAQPNTFEAATPTYNAYNNAAGKLVCNMVELSSQYGEFGKGSRKAGGSSADIGAPLMKEWSDGNSYTPSTPYGYSPPVAYKNLLVITTNNQVFVYDAHPSESLSGSGDPDDGFRDFDLGTSKDLVFQSATLPNPISSATCISAPNASGTSGTPPQPIMPDQIWVQDSTGKMWEWNAFGHFTDGNQGAEPPDHFVDPSSYPNLGPGDVDTGVAGGGPYAPTFDDGLLFATDMTGPIPQAGRVWIVDPTTPDQPLMSNSFGNVSGMPVPWVCGGNGWKYNAETSGPSTVANIPVFESPGATDRVVYMPIQPSTLNSTTCGFVSEWFGRKGETQLLPVSGGAVIITPDCYNKGLTPYFPGGSDLSNPTLMSLAPRITLMGVNGPASMSDTEQTITSIAPTGGSGASLTVTLNTGSSWYTKNVTSVPPMITLRIDYTVDWSNLGNPNPDYSRSSMNFPDDINRSRRIVDNIALGPTGIMYMVVSNTNPAGPYSPATSGTHPTGGSFYAVQEEGVGNFVVLNRWSLYDMHTENLAGVAGVEVPPTVENVDPLISLFPGLGNQSAIPSNPSLLQDLTFTSGPVVSNGVVYVTAQGDNGPLTGSPVVSTILLAFNAQPPPLTINVSSVSSGFTLMQYDMDEAQTRSAPTSPWVLPSTVYTYTAAPITDTGANTSNGVISLNSLTSAGGGQQIAGCFSTSQPIILRQVGSPDTLIYPDAAGSHWSPLMWYTMLTGSGLPPTGGLNSTTINLGPPFVSGNTVYVPTSNPTLSLLNGGGAYPAMGMVYGISTNISTTDPYLISDPAHPWQTQLAELNGGSSPISVNNIVPNSDFLWPQLNGVTSIVQLALRLSQATLGPLWNFSEGSPPAQATTALGVVGGNGRLFAWSDLGVYGFERANIFVADANRVASFDSDGNPLWSTDQTQNIGSTGYTGTVRKLVTPCRAYSLDNGQVLAVDPGSNRLAIVDQDGLELRTIEGFSVDPGYAPPDYIAGESTKLSAPRDVQVYTSVVPAANNSYTNPAPSGTEYWVHYLIADCGNGRLVDIVDRYTYDPVLDGPGDPVLYNGAPVQGVLYWHSPASASGARFSYTSVARVYVPTLTNGAGTGGYVVAAGIGNTSIGNVLQASPSATVNGTNVISPATGGIMIFPLVTGAAPVQISAIGIPALSGSLYVPTSELGGTFSATSPLTQRNIGAVNSLTAKCFAPTTGGAVELTFLYTDQTGVYEINAGSGLTTLTGQTWSVDWMLPRTLPTLAGISNSYLEVPVYSVMRQVAGQPTADNPLDFLPMYAERVASGDILVVNGYSGRYRKATSSVDNVPFTGEILELDPTDFNVASPNLGFTSSTIKAALSTITGARNIVQPLFADRR